MIAWVEDDGIFRFILAAVCDYAELNQAWHFYSSERPKPVNVVDKTWVEAAERLMSVGAGTPLIKLRILIEIYDGTKISGLLVSIERAIDTLIESEIDRLIEKEAEYETRTGNSSSWADAGSTVSDDQVRSMFSDLITPVSEN